MIQLIDYLRDRRWINDLVSIFRRLDRTPNPHLAFGLESRPDLIEGQPVWIFDANSPGGQRLNAAAFQATSAAQPGSLGRNAIQGFGMSQLDLALQREFRMRERLSAQIRAEAFNVFNHPNFSNPSLNGYSNQSLVGSSGFGISQMTLASALSPVGTLGGLNPLFQIGGPRLVQFSLRLTF